MTVTAPEFDPDLEGHTAIELDGVGHAAVTFPDIGDATECGIPLDRGDVQDVELREDLDEDLEWCGDCWPESVLE